MKPEDLKFALSVTHCPWIERRVASMERLRRTLGVIEVGRLGGDAPYREVTDRAPWWVWADKMWHWAAEQESTHAAFLQDDAVIAPCFWRALRSIVAARPGEIISLHCLHLGSMILAREGKRWCTTSDGLVGLGYVLPASMLREFLTWRREALRPGGAQELAEDSQINVFAMCTGRRIFHPIPTIIDHDLSIASTNAAQTAGRPRVRWTDEFLGWTESDLQDAAWWQGDAVHLGRQYAKTHWAARMVVPGFDRFFEGESELSTGCPPQYRRYSVVA